MICTQKSRRSSESLPQDLVYYTTVNDMFQLDLWSQSRAEVMVHLTYNLLLIVFSF